MTPQSLIMPVFVGNRRLTDPPRLRPRPDSDPSGYIDATWWPRSSNLAAELPDLIAALVPRAGQIWRIVCDPRAWSTTDRHPIVAGRAMRVDRYPFELFGLMYLCATNGTVIVLRAIPEGTDPALATSVLAAAGRTAPTDAARQ